MFLILSLSFFFTSPNYTWVKLLRRRYIWLHFAIKLSDFTTSYFCPFGCFILLLLFRFPLKSRTTFCPICWAAAALHSQQVFLSLTHTYKISVTRCWSKKQYKCFKKLSKMSQQQFLNKSEVFENCPKSCQSFGILLLDFLSVTTLKNRTFWSHCTRLTKNKQ